MENNTEFPQKNRTNHLFSVTKSCSTLQLHGLQHTRLPCPSLSPRVCSNSCPLSFGCHPTISPSATPFSPCPQSSPASGSFPVSRLFISDGQSIGASSSASVLPMNIQGRFPLGRTGWISLQPKELSRIFSSTTVRKHQFLGSQPSLWSNSHIHTELQYDPAITLLGTYLKEIKSLYQRGICTPMFPVAIAKTWR